MDRRDVQGGGQEVPAEDTRAELLAHEDLRTPAKPKMRPWGTLAGEREVHARLSKVPFGA
jgi:hypothetical protein